jgi:hypothetical protein|tara:strand:+ start:2757 stop:3131 length:375 start_codon:yes stop_codon:yes gene_type:complete
MVLTRSSTKQLLNRTSSNSETALFELPSKTIQMLTRSSSISDASLTHLLPCNTSQTFSDVIDWQDASDCWMENKKRQLNGSMYFYKCGFELKNHKKCTRKCNDKIGIHSGCKFHYMWNEKQQKI